MRQAGELAELLRAIGTGLGGHVGFLVPREEAGRAIIKSEFAGALQQGFVGVHGNANFDGINEINKIGRKDSFAQRTEEVGRQRAEVKGMGKFSIGLRGRERVSPPTILIL